MVMHSHRDNRPIYSQIVDSFRERITTGILQPGDKLPSVRELAAEMAINPNTIQRAYEALESEGYVYSVAGKGSFAAPCSQVDDRRQQTLLKQFDTAASELLFLGVTTEELIERLRLKGGTAT